MTPERRKEHGNGFTPPGRDGLIYTPSHSGAVFGVAVTPDGSWAVSASMDHTLKVWDTKVRKIIRTLKGHTHNVNSVAVTPDGNSAVSASYDRTLKVWDIKTGNDIRTLEGHTNGVKGVVVTPDGNSAVSASYDKTLKVWDIRTGNEIRTLKGHTDRVCAVTVTPDGNSAISASQDCTIKVWDIETGNVISTLGEHELCVNAVAATPDGNWAVSASSDKTLKVWNIHNGRLVCTLDGHTAEVLSVAVTQDSRYVISGAGNPDNTLRVWDIRIGDTIDVLKGHTGGVWGVAVTKDGRHAMSGSNDTTVRGWDLGAIIDHATAMERPTDKGRDLVADSARIKGKTESEVYDVFLCHNSKDKPQVKEIAEKLIERGIRPWLDEWHLRPGLPWQRVLEEQIEGIKSAAVFVGASGLGPWQTMELEAFLREFVRRGCPVIPVILADCSNPPDLPMFLKAMTWVDFRKSNPVPLDQLLWGITGEREKKHDRWAISEP